MAKRIAFLIDDLEVGDTGRNLYNQLTILKEHDVDACIYALVCRGSLLPKMEQLGYRVVSLGLTRINIIATLFKLAWSLRKENVDTLYCMRRASRILGPLAGKLGGVGRVVVKWTNRPTRRQARWMRMLETWCLRLSSHVVTSSNYLRRFIKHYYKMKIPITCCYDSVFVSDFQQPRNRAVYKEWGVDDEDTVIVSIGRLIPDRGYLVLLKAMKLLSRHHPRVFCFIIGEGPLAEELQEKIQVLSLEDRVRLLGEKNVVVPWILGADIFVQSSLSEGLGVGLMEAMAGKLPCVATHTAGIPEIVLDKKTGILVPTEEVRPLVAALEKLIEDRVLRETMGQAAHERVEECFDVRKNIGAWLSVMEIGSK